jgi:hypothetical protein
MQGTAYQLKYVHHNALAWWGMTENQMDFLGFSILTHLQPDVRAMIVSS